MYFNLQSDNGVSIVGYIVPDSFTGVPHIRVCSGGEELLVFAANEIRDGLVGSGRHETGNCGFRLDNTMLPNLPLLQDLEITDAETGILVYRRAPLETVIKKKILRLETSMFPLWALDDSLDKRFQYFARGAEKYGLESVTQMFLLDVIDSIYISARLLYPNYSFYIDKSNFSTMILLQDPHFEFAERLILFSKLNDVSIERLGLERERLRIRAAIEFARTLLFSDDRALTRALRSIPAEVAMLLANPVVRQLTTSAPDDMPKSGAVATALDCLASFAVVGLRNKPQDFLRSVGEYLGIEHSAMPSLPQFSQVSIVARRLKADRTIDALIESDCELYFHVVNAHAKLGAVGDVEIGQGG
jgi:hypothetical protein